MGADLVINLVKTVGADRPHERVLARANSIVNQVFTLSVNTAGPVGRGRSIIVDPKGTVLDESPDEAPRVFIHVLAAEEAPGRSAPTRSRMRAGRTPPAGL